MKITKYQLENIIKKVVEESTKAQPMIEENFKSDIVVKGHNLNKLLTLFCVATVSAAEHLSDSIQGNVWEAISNYGCKDDEFIKAQTALVKSLENEGENLGDVVKRGAVLLSAVLSQAKASPIQPE